MSLFNMDINMYVNLYKTLLSNDSMVELNNPHISDLLVFYNDCSKDYTLRHFRSTRVKLCVLDPSFENTRVVDDVFVSAIPDVLQLVHAQLT